MSRTLSQIVGALMAARRTEGVHLDPAEAELLLRELPGRDLTEAVVHSIARLNAMLAARSHAESTRLFGHSGAHIARFAPLTTEEIVELTLELSKEYRT